MALTIFVDPDVHVPAAVEARLARHIAELANEHAGFQTVLESIFDRDERKQQAQQDQRRVSVLKICSARYSRGEQPRG